MKIMSFKNKYHLSVLYLVCHISIGPVALLYLTNKDENMSSTEQYDMKIWKWYVMYLMKYNKIISFSLQKHQPK